MLKESVRCNGSGEGVKRFFGSGEGGKESVAVAKVFLASYQMNGHKSKHMSADNCKSFLLQVPISHLTTFSAHKCKLLLIG